MSNYLGKFGAVDRLEKAIEQIQRRIESEGGNLVIKMKVRLSIPPFTAQSHKHHCSRRPCRRRKNRILRSSWPKQDKRTQRFLVMTMTKKPSDYSWIGWGDQLGVASTEPEVDCA